MDVSMEYTGCIANNISSRLGFLANAHPELKDLIHATTGASGGVSKPRKKRVVNESPTWFRIRPIRRARSKYSSDESDGECDYEEPSENVQEHTNVESSENVARRLKLTKKPNQYGLIEGVVIGQWWKTRIECSHAGVHRPTVAGIHPGPDGAYSVALSGGYEGDWDLGDEFTYTGEGGRDLKGTKANPKNLRTAPQSKDQILTRGNLALHRSFDNGTPVRVIRGYKLKSFYAPEDGYRYDGLYHVVKIWTSIGESGFLIYKFQFSRFENQLPLIDSMDSVLLFTSIKKRKSSSRQGLRSSTSAKQSNDMTSESCDEDSQQGLMDSNSQLDDDEDKDVSVNFFCHEANDSKDMFCNGRFLGWDNSVQDYEDAVKTFKSMLKKLEDRMADFDVQEDCSGNEDPSSGEDITLPDNPSPETIGSRRKSHTPRKVVRRSSSKSMS